MNRTTSTIVNVRTKRDIHCTASWVDCFGIHDDALTWKCFSHYSPFVMRIHRYPHKDQQNKAFEQSSFRLCATHSAYIDGFVQGYSNSMDNALELLQSCAELWIWHPCDVRVGRGAISHDDVIKWKYFPCNWPFVRGIHRWPVNSPHKGQWRGVLMFLWSAP